MRVIPKRPIVRACVVKDHLHDTRHRQQMATAAIILVIEMTLHVSIEAVPIHMAFSVLMFARETIEALFRD
jgi:hypothetical protein